MTTKKPLNILDDIPEELLVAFKYTGPSPLHEACANNDVAAVKELVHLKDVNAYNEEGLRPLHVAVTRGHVRIVRLLLQLDIDVNTPDKKTGRTPLHHACAGGQYDIVESLLLRGAVVFEQDMDGAYPMHLAAANGSSDVISQLTSVGGLVTCRDKNDAEPLHYAAKHNKAATVKTLVRCGADLNVADVTGATPLHIAASRGHVETIQQMTELGASIDSRCKAGETPLQHSATRGRASAIEALVKLGADIGAKNKLKECALHTCARLGVWQSIPTLIKVGFNVAVPYKHKIQALHLAAQHGQCEAIRVLCQSGADVNAKDKKGCRPIHFAVVADKPDAIRTLVRLNADINAQNKKGNSPVHVAAKHQNPVLVQLLGSLGADSNIENKLGVFPLYYSAILEDHVTGRALIRAKADIDRMNKEGDRMVHILTEEGYTSGLSTLQALKADMSLMNQDGLTCVHMAALDLSASVLNHLKRMGVDINLPDKHGLSALHVAALEGAGERVDLLHDIGADLNCPSKDFKRTEDMPHVCRLEWAPSTIEAGDFWKLRLGLSPLQMAFLGNHKGVFRHLLTCGADINHADEAGETVFHLAVLFRRLAWLEELLGKGVNRNCVDKLGRTALHYAAHYGNLEATKYLLKSGASLAVTDKDGRLPLHYAAEAGHYLLLSEFTGQSKAVDINSLDNMGRTPLHYACKSGNIDTIQELVQLGAEVSITDKIGNTVVHIAAESGSVDTIVLLASMGCNVDVRNKNGQTPLHVAGENCQGLAMEFLLMCGCDPSVRDANDLLPSTFRLRGDIKQAVMRRIKQVTSHTAARNVTGEVCQEGRVVRSGHPVQFPRLGITITLTSVQPVVPLIFFHRTPSDASTLEIPVTGLEEILSDVYDMRVLSLNRKCTLTMEIPMDGYPGMFESILKTSKGHVIKEFTTSEENGVPKFVGKIPVEADTVITFAVLVRPQTFTHDVKKEGNVVVAEADRRLRLFFPQGAFGEDIKINLQVLKTNDTDIMATDVVNVELPEGCQPGKDVNVVLPLHRSADDCDVTVFCIHNMTDIDTEKRWETVNSHVKIKNDCVSFNVKHLSIFVTIVMDRQVPLETRKHLAREKIKTALQRETSVLFFYAVSPRKDVFLTVFECTTPVKFDRRKEFWEKEGFQLHPQLSHSGHFVARPNQEFYFSISGNLQQLTRENSKWSLCFNPRSYRYHSFYLKQVERNKPLVGEIHIMTSFPENEMSFVTSLPVEVKEISKMCSIS